ncbi:hypothetical protein SAMN02745823_03785 [Sporobacter termitidis DSM 10068]|uniref:Uncharacterized protein n=1 Tax=Sporobacter termitidis DSM 10068 TaxID=1123282 RepID=A0A1M5ZI61_9FIRM|nr:hypothetical protein [Sporobacter termitidis]SHI23920.1 hypothetical protein SAMN02745823_03785 [Sporobacter termitidis DSM 10068]
MLRNAMPEPPIDPPDERYLTAGCGHEVYEGERLVEWHDGKRFAYLCEECFRDKLAALTTEELARQFGCDCRTVLF